MNAFENIKSALGEPFFETSSTLLFNMDCGEGLSLIKAAGIKVDITVTSPPYNIGKEYEETLPVQQYIEWLTEINSLIYDVTKSNGAYLLNVGYLELKGKGSEVELFSLKI